MPAEFVVAVKFEFVPICTAVTLAPLITACCGSCTVPVIEPVVIPCPKANEHHNRTGNKSNDLNLDMSSPVSKNLSRGMLLNLVHIRSQEFAEMNDLGRSFLCLV
jgi:hypothetical protein